MGDIRNVSVWQVDNNFGCPHSSQKTANWFFAAGPGEICWSQRSSPLVIVLNLSWPAVSHIWSFTHLLSKWIFLILKSILRTPTNWLEWPLKCRIFDAPSHSHNTATISCTNLQQATQCVPYGSYKACSESVFREPQEKTALANTCVQTSSNHSWLLLHLRNESIPFYSSNSMNQVTDPNNTAAIKSPWFPCSFILFLLLSSSFLFPAFTKSSLQTAGKCTNLNIDLELLWWQHYWPNMLIQSRVWTCQSGALPSISRGIKHIS